MNFKIIWRSTKRELRAGIPAEDNSHGLLQDLSEEEKLQDLKMNDDWNCALVTSQFF